MARYILLKKRRNHDCTPTDNDINGENMKYGIVKYQGSENIKIRQSKEPTHLR